MKVFCAKILLALF